MADKSIKDGIMNQGLTAYKYVVKREGKVISYGVTNDLERTRSDYCRRQSDVEVVQMGSKTTYQKAYEWHIRQLESIECETGVQLIISVVSEEQLGHIRIAERELERAGVTFDIGSDTEDDKVLNRMWKLDCSLRGAEVR